MTRQPRPAPPHGTRERYQGSMDHEGCRCPACRGANSAYMRRWRRGGRPIRWTEPQLWPEPGDPA